MNDKMIFKFFKFKLIFYDPSDRLNYLGAVLAWAVGWLMLKSTCSRGPAASSTSLVPLWTGRSKLKSYYFKCIKNSN